MRVLLLSRYSRLAASSRQRMLQYVPYLEQAGVEVVPAPLLGEDYVRRLYQRGSGFSPSVLWRYGKRLGALLSASRFDLLWVEKELFPWLPALAEMLLKHFDIPYVVDYDDAVFHRYDRNPSSLIRKATGKKIDSVMRHAALVIAGNDYLADRAWRAGAPRVECLPTVIDLERYRYRPKEASASLAIGWMGSPVTAKYLAEVQPVLASLCRAEGMRVILVGGGEVPWPGVPVESRAWSEERESCDIADFDVGIMPLPDGPWERGKCGYKLIQYMACGRPVVASPVGVNPRIVEHGRNGFLARTPEEWRHALLQLGADAALRRRMGEAGRRRVEGEFCLQVTAPRILALLKAAAV